MKKHANKPFWAYSEYYWKNHVKDQKEMNQEKKTTEILDEFCENIMKMPRGILFSNYILKQHVNVAKKKLQFTISIGNNCVAVMHVWYIFTLFFLKYEFQKVLHIWGVFFSNGTSFFAIN